MINVGTLLNRCNNLLNKDQSGNTYPPDKYNNDLQFILWKYLKQRYGLPEQPTSPIAYEVVQKITDDIAELKVWMGGPDPTDPTRNTPLLKIDSRGVAEKPSDYWHQASCFYTQMIKDGCGEQQEKVRIVDFVTEDQRAMRLADALMKPTARNPIACIYSDFIQFYPKNLYAVNFTYLRKPETPFYDYDIVNDQVVFLPAGSFHADGTPSRTVDLPLPDDCYEDLAVIMLADMGLSLRDQMPLQVAEQRKISGF